jgi:hypothetical protein
MALEHRLSFSFGRLYEAVERSPVAGPWLARSRIDAAVRLLHADGVGVDRDRVLRHCHDLPLPHRSDADTPVATLLARLAAPPASGPSDRLAQEIHGADGLTQLYAALYRWLRTQGQPSQGYVLVMERLARLDLVPQTLWALAQPAGPAVLAERDWVESALQRLERATATARQDLAGLALTLEEWRNRLGSRRRNSRLDQVLLDVAGMLVATPVAIARRHDLSVRGAAAMLDELMELGILVEITGRRSWKIYVPADQTIMPAAAAGRLPSRLQALTPPDVEPLLADADAAIARAQAALARSRPRPREDGN